MTVIVTRMPGGITQLFNTTTSRVTYKCKSELAYMMIEAFGGIVKFNQKGAIATVSGHLTSLDSCNVIKEDDPNYKEALIVIIHALKLFAENKAETYQKEIQGLEHKLSNLN